MNGTGVKGVWDKYRYTLLVILIGAGLMLWPAGAKNKTRTPETQPLRDIQQEMEEILGKISGVGQVRVLLTEESDGERILAENISENVRERDSQTTEYSRTSGTVFIDAGSGRDEIIVIQTRRPTYRGALIVCQGGDRPAVRLAVTQAVSALTGLPSGRIAVEKWE